eukprot:m.139553 g.139553  ORF g.139553 m.139553 type:complete len:347 (+) comp17631_c0_seq1:280-1320(+)
MVYIENGKVLLNRGVLAQTSKDGSFARRPTSFRNTITPSGSDGPFPAEAGRYHLYISNACPWANRTSIVRKLKGLQDIVGMSVVHPYMEDAGWRFNVEDDATDPEFHEDPKRKNFPGSTVDHVHGAKFLSEIYVSAEPNYTGSVTTPLLLDTKTNKIVNNESAEIIHMFNSAFDALLPEGSPQRALDLAPASLHDEIEELSATIHASVNNGVYRCGFAKAQVPYETAFKELFDALDTLEERLSTRRFLFGNNLTLADIRLFVTLVRFDRVYFVHFKCSKKAIRDYPNLFAYTRDVYQYPGVGETVYMDHIANHYYWSHKSINPFQIVSSGIVSDFTEPTDRATKFQ